MFVKVTKRQGKDYIQIIKKYRDVNGKAKGESPAVQNDDYYSVVTPKLNMDDLKIREIYRWLVHIEDSFKITKTDFHSRPAFVFTDEHIEAHFQTCFTSLVLIRLLENKLNNKYIPSQILDSLRKCNCVHIKENISIYLF